MQSDDDPGAVLEIGLVTDVWDRMFFHEYFAAILQDPGEDSIDILNLHGVDGAAEFTSGRHQTAVDARGALVAAGYQPVVDRTLPLLDLPAENVPLNLAVFSKSGVANSKWVKRFIVYASSWLRVIETYYTQNMGKMVEIISYD